MKTKSILSNKFFIRRFGFFFTAMIIPTIVIFVLFIVYIGNNFNSTLVMQGNNSLSAIDTNFDVAIGNVAYQQSLMTSNQNLILSLKKLMMRGGDYDYGDDVFLQDFSTTLRSVIYSHSYIDSIYIYLDGYNKFFSSDQNGVVDLKNYSDVDWLKDYLGDHQLQYQWIVKRIVKQNSFTTPENVLTVFQRMSAANGVIVINIDENKLISIINSIATDSNQYVYMLEGDGSMLLSNRKLTGPGNKIRDGYFKNSFGKNGTSLSNFSGRWILVGGKYYLMSSLTYSGSRICFVSLISDAALFEQFKKFSLNFLLILFGNCLIVLFLSYATTSRIFSQINYMIHVFGRAENGLLTDLPKKKLKDEYDVVMNNIIHLFIKNTQINNQLTERQHSLEVAELTALQLQINPHFLFNTLQTMDLEATKRLGSRSTINEIIQALSDILKYSLGSPEQPVSLREELNYLKEYVTIQKYRFGDQFIVYYEVDATLLDYHVFRLMLQPLLENSITHGVRALKRTGFIKIKVYRPGNYLVIRVIDNGIGLTHGEVSALNAQINDVGSKSIGLTNVNRRLILEYGDDCGLIIRSKKGVGTSIAFKIPLR